ncbi:hypothetical protein [Avibacterium paragallinarum]|uniref:hypothetical protein n=1 Tax=Avibacterium paragallinarum TaxID=728 RepID=UPI00397BB5EA
MKKYLGLFLLAGLCSSPLLAEDHIVFSCFTAKDKQIALIESEGYYEYSFGKLGKPELVFKPKIVLRHKNQYKSYHYVFCCLNLVTKMVTIMKCIQLIMINK